MEETVINIISLPKRTDRRESIVKQMELEGIDNYKIWDGIPHMQPKIGINRAHKQIVQYAKENNLEEVVVAEDDLMWTGTGAWKYFLSQKPVDYDLFVGNYYSGYHDSDCRVFGLRGLTLYFCHSRFFDKFLSLPEIMHIDGAIANSGAKVIVCEKFVCRQSPGFSDQRKRHTENKIIGKQMFGE
jgi:hypothetical protein